MKVHKIVLTGGPCAGKSTALQIIRDYFASNYNVYTVPETATELMSNGVKISDFETTETYQRCQMQLHRSQEETFMFAANMNKANDNDCIVICDRGQFDCKAYMDEEEFEFAMIDIYGGHLYAVDRVFQSYDAVFHLSTSARGAEFAYSSETNKIRGESAEEAIKLDEKIHDAWCGHHYYRFIPSYENFDHKMEKLINEIQTYLNS